MEILLHLQLLVLERGWEVGRPVLELTAARTHLHTHVQWAGARGGLGRGKQLLSACLDVLTLGAQD